MTLLQILVRIGTETHRHAGQPGILRELIDGSVGLCSGNENLPDVDADWWVSCCNRLEDAARQATD